jgi:carotenoid cleavage dioxygenase-like enzyme
VYVTGDGYKVVKQQRESHERQEIAKISLSQFPAPSWIHDFPITKNYVVVPETPIYFNMLVSPMLLQSRIDTRLNFLLIMPVPSQCQDDTKLHLLVKLHSWGMTC